MKVEYQIEGSGAYNTLFDESAGTAILSEFPPSFKSLNQQDPLYRSQNQFRKSRGNIVCSLPLSFNLTYASRAACLASIRTFAALMDEKITLRVSEGGETQYYPNGLVEDYHVKLNGVSADHSFTFSTDNVTQTVS